MRLLSCQPMLSRVDKMPRRGKQLLAVVADAVTIALALWLVLVARLEVVWPTFGTVSVIDLAGIVIAVGLPVFWGAGLYREITRYIGLRFAIRVAYATVVTALVVSAILVMAGRSTGIPRSTPFTFVMAAFLGVIGTRALARHFLRRMHGGKQSRIVIFGASDVGAGLVALLAQDQRSQVVAFVDDDERRVGTFRCTRPRTFGAS